MLMICGCITRTHRMAKWMHSKCTQIVWSCQRNANNFTLIYRFVCCLCVAHFFYSIKTAAVFKQSVQLIANVQNCCTHNTHSYKHSFVHSLGEKEGQIEHEHNTIYSDKTYCNIVDWVTRVCFCFHIWPHSTIEAPEKKLRGKNVERRRKRGCNGYAWKYSKYFVSLNDIAQFSHQIFSLLKLLLLGVIWLCIVFGGILSGIWLQWKC